MAREITALITGERDNLPRQIAMAHSLMPIINHMVIFPLLPLIVRLFNRLVPPEPPKEVFGAQFLSDTMLSEPSVALYQVKKELLRMVPIIESMLSESLAIFKNYDLALAKAIKSQDKMIDTLRKEIVVYLSKLARQPLSQSEGTLQVAFLFIVSELENLADVIERNILDRAKKLISKNKRLSEEGLEDVAALGAIVASNYKLVMQSFQSDELEGARAVLADAERCWELQREFRRKHFKRLNEGVQVSIETTEVHMDLLNHLHRVNRHLYHIAQTLIELQSPS
jgi:phosphate:Na+ symporter